MPTSIADLERAERARKAEAAKAIRAAKAQAQRDLGRWLLERANDDKTKRTFDEQVERAKSYVEQAEAALVREVRPAEPTHEQAQYPTA